MHNLEALRAVDITDQINDARVSLGIPDRVSIEGTGHLVFPPKQVVVFSDPADLHAFVVDRWIQAARDSSGGHIIPTGGTFEPVYEEAARRKTELTPLLKQRDISNLDEVWPIRDGDPNISLTYIIYRNTRVVTPLGLSEGQCIIPDGTTENPEEEVVLFERKLAQRSWDFAMLGIGPDEKSVDGRVIPASPHIGFIPAGTRPEQTALFITLDEGTLFANSRGAPDPKHFFTHAMTQGPGDIRRAQRHLLAATGTYKKENIRNVLLSPVSLEVPASQILLYPETTVAIDREAAQLILDLIDRLPGRTSFPSAKIQSHQNIS